MTRKERGEAARLFKHLMFRARKLDEKGRQRAEWQERVARRRMKVSR